MFKIRLNKEETQAFEQAAPFRLERTNSTPLMEGLAYAGFPVHNRPKGAEYWECYGTGKEFVEVSRFKNRVTGMAKIRFVSYSYTKQTETEKLRYVWTIELEKM